MVCLPKLIIVVVSLLLSFSLLSQTSIRLECWKKFVHSLFFYEEALWLFLNSSGFFPAIHKRMQVSLLWPEVHPFCPSVMNVTTRGRSCRVEKDCITTTSGMSASNRCVGDCHNNQTPVQIKLFYFVSILVKYYVRTSSGPWGVTPPARSPMTLMSTTLPMAMTFLMTTAATLTGNSTGVPGYSRTTTSPTVERIWQTFPGVLDLNWCGCRVNSGQFKCHRTTLLVSVMEDTYIWDLISSFDGCRIFEARN